ncbi:uncharacterized protein LOC128670568 [Plodia interpunctella]|uniref:uncharacterized protein LOC128670568 n=1 Tax=Plodia interpunctella TaxID=58824 RepID=UPI002368C0AC|nr:uncharacterized protein LOC128670568 [Plodia interpunctella]XP_053602313.1 uncharacterized protein LOC128670568 [Plodia interpunctella]
MSSAVTTVLACLCLARVSLAEAHSIRQSPYNTKDLTSVLSNIEERLRVLDTISAVQAKQARRLDVIQDKLDRLESSLFMKQERAQLAAERLEHRLHMLQLSVQTSIKDSNQKIEKSHLKVAEVAQNLTSQIDLHRRLLDKVNGAYADTWHRGLVLESLMRDGLSLVNVTRRELADGIRALARRQRDARLNTADLESVFVRRLNERANKIDIKMQEVLDTQKRFVDSCQRVQLDDPTHVADVLDKLIDSLINKTAATFHELQNIQMTMRNHNSKVMKLLTAGRPRENDVTCKRLETVFRNASQTTMKEIELQQLTEKFVDLTNRADAALQKLERSIADTDDDPPTAQPSEVTAAADRLLLRLKGIKTEKDEASEDPDWGDESDGFYDDGGGGDIMEEDMQLLTKAERSLPGGPENGRPDRAAATLDNGAVRPHRRHLHKHPYDRGPA